MNKTLLLVLVTIVQSQSDGTLLSTNPILDSLDDNHNGLYLEDLEDLEYPRVQLPSEDIDDEKLPIVRKRSAVDPLTRRSALDKNFMRFGRSGFFPDDNTSKTKNLMRFADDGLVLAERSPNSNFVRFGRGVQDNFLRFGKGQKDNFIRFGRAKDNFIRFGRGPNDNFMRFGKSAKDNFIRFGKPDKNFMRFGKSDQNFMRFGKSDKNFMRFGRDFEDEDFDEDDLFYRLGKSNSNFLRFGKSPKSGTSFVRFGKSPKKADNFIRFGRSSKENRNNTNFLRFGRDEVSGGKDPSEVDDVTDSEDLGDLDLNGDKLKNGPIIRIKRNVDKRDAEIMEEIPKLKYDDPAPGYESEHQHHDAKRSTDDLEKLSNQEKALKSIRQLILSGDSSRPFRLLTFPNFLLTPETLEESKRNQGGSNSGSNFIRFG